MKLTLLDFVLKGIPEVLIFVLGIFAFSKRKINGKQYGLVAVIIIISTYFIRLLPINYGVNTLLTVGITAILGIKIIKIPLIQAIKVALLTTVCVLIGEGVNFYLLQVMYGSEKTLEIIGDPIAKVINTIPSTIVFGMIIGSAYYFNVVRKRKVQDVIPSKEDLENPL